MKPTLAAVFSVSVALATLAGAQQRRQPEVVDTIDGDPVYKMLEVGGIPAIDDPVYVPASEAQIRPEAWVLGVVIDDQARAYSLELLNGHEVVNDTIGDTDFAAVW